MTGRPAEYYTRVMGNCCNNNVYYEKRYNDLITLAVLDALDMKLSSFVQYIRNKYKQSLFFS